MRSPSAGLTAIPVSVPPLDEVRGNLIRAIWKSGALPAGTITADVASAITFPDGADAWRIWTVSNAGGRGGHVYVDFVTPTAEENGRIIIVHSGHIAIWWGWDPLWNMVEAALAEGYCVLGMGMPTYSPNPNPETLTVGGSPTQFTQHAYISLDSDGGNSSIAQFVDPVIMAINQAAIARPGYKVTMMGHSGGGWTAEFAAAVDTRILYSASVHGSSPWDIYPSQATDVGDWETFRSNPVYAYGGRHLIRHALRSQERLATNIMSDLDWVYPTVGLHDQLSAFESQVNARIREKNSGTYTIVYDDEAQTHTVSAWAIAKILSDIDGYL